MERDPWRVPLTSGDREVVFLKYVSVRIQPLKSTLQTKQELIGGSRRKIAIYAAAECSELLEHGQLVAEVVGDVGEAVLGRTIDITSLQQSHVEGNLGV